MERLLRKKSSVGWGWHVVVLVAEIWFGVKSRSELRMDFAGLYGAEIFVKLSSSVDLVLLDLWSSEP